MSLLALFVAMTATLAVNYKWALVDPHRPSDGPSWRGALATALWVMALFAVARLLLDRGFANEAALLNSFAFGTAISPSIAPPYVLRPEEEPRRLRRFLASRLHGLRVISVKLVLLLPLGALVELVVSRHASFYASALIALVFSVTKAVYLADLMADPAFAARYRDARAHLPGRGVVGACGIGTAALLAWLVLVYPTVTAFPEAHLDDWATVLAFVLGVLLRPN